MTFLSKYGILPFEGIPETVGGQVFLIFTPTAHLNRREVIRMMDQYVTFGDLLKICSVLLSLANLIVYIYYNHKNSNDNHRKNKKK